MKWQKRIAHSLNKPWIDGLWKGKKEKKRNADCDLNNKENVETAMQCKCEYAHDAIESNFLFTNVH